MTNIPQFKKGQKVRCIYGDVFTVYRQEGTTVWVLEMTSTVHATKVFAI